MATDIGFLLLIITPIAISIMMLVLFLRANIRKGQELEVGSLYDRCQKLMESAGTLQARGEYRKALMKYQQAKAGLLQAYSIAQELADRELKAPIQKALKDCEKEIINCASASEHEKLEGLIEDANYRIERAKGLRLDGSLEAARQELEEASAVIQGATPLASRYESKEHLLKITRTTNLIRDEFVLLKQSEGGPAPDVRRPAPEEEGDLKVKSDYDYKEGFVRLFVSLINLRDTVVTEAQVRLLHDENFMRLDHIHPKDVELCGKDATIGTIGPAEKKTIEFFLDPMVCQTVNIDAQITYKDARGKFRTAFMKQLPVGIQCPIFADSDTVNTATAVNLAVQVLTRRDRKVFLVPPTLTPSEAFLIAKEIVQTRDVKHVSDLLYKKEFGAMAYYYGKTKQREQFIIRVTALDATNSIELFVACDSEPMLTGELAKLAQELNERLMRERIIRQPIQQVTISIRDSVLQRSNIIFKDGLAKADIEIKDSVVSHSDIG